MLGGPRGPFPGGEEGPRGGDLGVDLSGEVWVETPADEGNCETLPFGLIL